MSWRRIEMLPIPSRTEKRSQRLLTSILLSVPGTISIRQLQSKKWCSKMLQRSRHARFQLLETPTDHEQFNFFPRHQHVIDTMSSLSKLPQHQQTIWTDAYQKHAKGGLSRMVVLHCGCQICRFWNMHRRSGFVLYISGPRGVGGAKIFSTQRFSGNVHNRGRSMIPEKIAGHGTCRTVKWQ